MTVSYLRCQDALLHARSPLPMAVVAFCVATACWPGLYSWAAAPKWWAMAIGLSIFASFDIRKLDPVIAALAACGVLMAGLSLLESPHFYGGILDFVCLILLCGSTVGAAALEDVGPVIEAFCWGVSISVAASVLQVFGWYVVPHIGYAGLYLNSEVMGEVAAILFIWTFWKRKWFLTAVMGLSLVLCMSRIGFFVVACGLLYGWRANPWVKRGLLASAVAVGFFAIWYVGAYKLHTAMMRFMLWGAAVLSLTPAGGGLAWWHAAHPFPLEEYVHSDALQWMVEVGLGSVFFLAIPVMVMRRGTGELAERAMYLGVCVEAVVSFPIHLPMGGFLAAVLTGHLASRVVDVRVARSQRGMDGFAGHGWSSETPAGLARWCRRGRALVSVRPAYSGFADAGFAAGHGEG